MKRLQKTLKELQRKYILPPSQLTKNRLYYCLLAKAACVEDAPVDALTGVLTHHSKKPLLVPPDKELTTAV